MNKSLQILLGLVLILVLAYVAFLDVSTKIKDDLLSKTKVIFSENNVRGVTADIEGDDLSISRNLVLTGTAISEVERVRIVTLIENIEGISTVDNQIRLHPVVPKAPLVPTIPKVPMVIKVPVVETSSISETVKTALKEVVIKENKVAEVVVAKKESLNSVSSSTINTKVPLVPEVVSHSIVVPTPVKAISAPKVIEVEKMKFEGVK